MENKIESVLFSAIRNLFSPISLSMVSLSEEELSALYALAKKHDMAHLVGATLEKEGLLGEGALRAKFQKQALIAVLRQERFDYELSQIRSLLEEASIRFLPLKGSVIRPLYPEAWMRTSCDIDVLVDEENLDAAVKLLCEKLGYEAEADRNYHDISLHAPSGVHLELHFSILEHMESLDGELSRVWEFSSPISEGSSEYRMTNEYLVFHTVAHMSYHFVHGGCGIRPFLDLFLMREKLPLDEAILLTHLRACSLEQFYESAIALSEVWFSDRAPTDVTCAMQEFLLSGGVYGSEVNRISVAQGKKGSRGGYLLGRIFLPYEDLCLRYSVLKKKKWLFPICQVRRWGRILFGGKAKRSMRELRVSANISDEKRDRTGELLKKLGL